MNIKLILLYRNKNNIQIWVCLMICLLYIKCENNANNNEQMQLPDQLLKQVRLLTDKPISPKVNKQLLPLLLHENLALDKTIQLLCLKYRCDLLNHLLQNNRFPSQSSTSSMLTSILNNILQYKIADVLQLYIHLLANIENNDKKILELGYNQIVKLAIKLPNLQTKEKLFQILLSNFQYLYKRKSKQIIIPIITNYLQVFNKFLIYVPTYVRTIELVLQIDKNSKKIINLQHPQRQAQLQQIFIDLSSQELSNIKNQTLAIMQNTKDKLNYYSLHRNCLNALKKIADILNQNKVKESQLLFTELDVGQICRNIELFADRKGTLDEAKLAKAAWLKRAEQLKKIKSMKSEKYIDPERGISLIMDKKEAEKPLLIQQIISMTNNYRLKYQVSPAQNEEATPSKLMSVSNNFLKKGIGVGGGRTYLLNQKQKSVFKQENKNKRLYNDIVDRCFDYQSKQVQYKSFVQPKLHNPSEKGINIQIVESQDENERRVENIELNQTQQLDIDWNSMPAFSQNQMYKEQRSTNKNIKNKEINKNVKDMQNSMKASSLIEDDEQVQQINNLIDLAYSYKFT